MTPALLMSRSIPSVAEWMADAASATEPRSSSSSSISTGSGPGPLARRSAAASAALVRFRHAMITVAPLARSARAVSSPSPLLAPVTTAV